MIPRNKEAQSSGTNHHVVQLLPQFRSIRARLTGWYTMTTLLILLLYGGLLYSTIEKMLPSTTPSQALYSIAHQIILMGECIFLIVAVSGLPGKPCILYN